MSSLASLDKLTTTLARLPGVGRKSAERMALRIVRDPHGILRDLVSSLESCAASIRCCSQCGSITGHDADPCRLCRDPSRDDALLCVVEDPNDILRIEESGGFRGRYHALMGKLSPMKGTGPAELRMQALAKRVADGGIKEVLLALDTDMEGDSTAGYIAELFRESGVRVTRLAFGLPAGSGVFYSDPVTLARAIRGRQDA